MTLPVSSTANSTTFSAANPLSEPLRWYHGHVVRTFEALPKRNAILEVIKRIIVIALIPVAYPLLGFAALIGRIIAPSKEVNGNQMPTRPPLANEMYLSFRDMEERVSLKLVDAKRAKLFVIANAPEGELIRTFNFSEPIALPISVSELLNEEDRATIEEWDMSGRGYWRYVLLTQNDEGIWRLCAKASDSGCDQVLGPDVIMNTKENLDRCMFYIRCPRPERTFTFEQILSL